MERYLGAKIKELRQSRNWTQAYLAERLNKSVSTVSGYESDAHPVPTDVLISIAELFGISLDALLGLERPTGVSTQGLSASQIKIVEELIAAAINDAVKQVEKISQEKITQLTSGLNSMGGFMDEGK